MAAEVGGATSQRPGAAAPVPRLCQFHQQHHHVPFTPLFHPHHHHQHHLPHRVPPRPFLCTRCKWWNFPPNNTSSPYPNYPHPHPHGHGESTEMQAQELAVEVNHQGQTISFDSCGLDNVEEVEEENYEFVMTDEWIEFFAKSEARRQEKKMHQKKAARDLRKATRARPQAEEHLQHLDEERAQCDDDVARR